MEATSWSYDSWKPTGGVAVMVERHSEEMFTMIHKQLGTDIGKVRELPHHPLWRLEKAFSLSMLNYPELAIAEAHKALLLAQAGLFSRAELGERVRITVYGKAASWDALDKSQKDEVKTNIRGIRKRVYMFLNRELLLLRALPDAIEVCKEALKFHTRDSDLLDRLKQSEMYHANFVREQTAKGGIPLDQMAWSELWNRAYPWAPAKIYSRGEETLKWANQQLGEAGSAVRIQESPLAPGCLGVFATRDIKQGETITDTPSATGISNSQVTGEYCYNCAEHLIPDSTLSFDCCRNMKFCGEECRSLADAHYHKALCGKNFDEFYERARSKDRPVVSYSRVNLVFLRFLAICVQSKQSPLEHPFISSLTANYEAPTAKPWTYRGHVTGPQEILQILGVDIFGDETFDQWVLETIWSRVMNNSMSNGTGPDCSVLHAYVINSTYSFFNHSCDPDAVEANTTSRSTMIAIKDIVAGDEVFTTYLESDLLGAPKSVRQQNLRKGPWFDARGCRCKKCESGQ